MDGSEVYKFAVKTMGRTALKSLERANMNLDELDYFESSDELFMRKDILDRLIKKVEELPERSREIFRLSYFEGLKAAEIAEQLGVSVRTVENQLYRSLLYLRKHCSNLFIYFFIL